MLTFAQVETKDRKNKRFRHELVTFYTLLLVLIVLLIAFPLFIIIYNHIPPIYLPFTNDVRIDHILTFLVVFAVLYFIARKIRHFLYLGFGTFIFTLVILNYTGRYSFQQLYHDYSSFVYSLNKTAIRFEFIDDPNEKLTSFPHEAEFREAIDYTHEIVRNYAAEIAVAHFEEYSNVNNMRLIQFFSIFKEIRKKWRYVYDPIDQDYFSKASETVNQLRSDGKFKGDCDDYCILMSSCIKAVGGRVKIVKTMVETPQGQIGHVYPEVLVGNVKDLENITYLIKQVLFVQENNDKSIYYHLDNDNLVWLNFDYNDYYPGGKYQSKLRKAEMEV